MHEMNHEYIWAHWDNQRGGGHLSQREADLVFWAEPVAPPFWNFLRFGIPCRTISASGLSG
jgi:hypothetical protein